MKNTFLLTICFLFVSLSLRAQRAVKDIVANKLVKIYSIDPTNSDFSDVEVIGKAIGNSKVVMLGEQDHGDGTTFSAKTMLIRYLHEQKGFNVLAFESDFFNLNMDWERAINKQINVKGVWRNNLYSLWTTCEQNKFLFHYLDSCFYTNNPIILTGFDSRQFRGYHEVEFFVRYFS